MNRNVELNSFKDYFLIPRASLQGESFAGQLCVYKLAIVTEIVITILVNDKSKLRLGSIRKGCPWSRLAGDIDAPRSSANRALTSMRWRPGRHNLVRVSSKLRITSQRRPRRVLPTRSAPFLIWI